MPDDATFHRYESQVRTYCRDFPAVFDRAEGPYLWDTRGRRFTDLLCGAGALNYGHNDPRIGGAVRDYLLHAGPVTSLDLYTVAKRDFIEQFVSTIAHPRRMDFLLQFPGPAGTLAVEAAVKLARKVTGRANVVAFSGGFHGASLGALALSSSPLLRGAAGTPLDSATILPYDPGASGGLDAVGVNDALDALATALGPRGGIEAPAAFVVETVQGEGGLNAASTAWLTGLRRLADDTGALLIVDDIQAGCGRTGSFFSFDGIDLRPDIVCLSKSLSGVGLPMAMVLLRRDLDHWRPGEHNGTFRGNNLAFVAATEALRYWADPGFRAHVGRLTDEVLATVDELVAAHPGQAGAAGRGLMSGVRFADPERAEELKRRLYDRGVIAETSGGGRVLKMFPPLTMSVAQWRETAETLLDVATPASGGRSRPATRRGAAPALAA